MSASTARAERWDHPGHGPEPASPGPLGGGSGCPGAAAQLTEPGRCGVGKYQERAALLSYSNGLAAALGREIILSSRAEAAVTPVAPSAWPAEAGWARMERGGRGGLFARAD